VSPFAPCGKTRLKVCDGDVPAIVAAAAVPPVTEPIVRTLLGPVKPWIPCGPCGPELPSSIVVAVSVTATFTPVSTTVTRVLVSVRATTEFDISELPQLGFGMFPELVELLLHLN
jgi:hypothetical protein